MLHLLLTSLQGAHEDDIVVVATIIEIERRMDVRGGGLDFGINTFICIGITIIFYRG